MNSIDIWVKSCLRKKKLKEKWADDIINRAKTPLRKYKCPHCDHWHITKKMKQE
jgi:hypothetical protein